jgi:hypothetical protein
MNDGWYSPVRAKSGKTVSGGAALLVRTQALGGQDAIVENVAREAARNALAQADAAVQSKRAKPNLRLVANG